MPAGSIDIFPAAASVSLALFIAAEVLYYHFKNEMIGNSTKKQNPFSLLVWGGATSVGQMLIQLAKISGAYDSIIAVASKKHEKILKRYGADSVYDYHDNDVIAKITQAYPNIKHFIGAVSDGKSLIRDVTRCF